MTRTVSMQSYCLDACGNLTLPRPPLHPLLRRRRSSLAPRPPSPASSDGPACVSTAFRICCGLSDGRRRRRGGGRRLVDEPAVRAKRKENVWSVDNDLATSKARDEGKGPRESRQRRRRGRRTSGGRRNADARVLVSSAMLIEVETVLQTQEPVIKPVWNTFASSISGIWKGVGAVFSPLTAEIEPISLSNKNENLYDCYTLSRVEKVSREGLDPRIQRKTNWVALNPFGETHKNRPGDSSSDNHEHYAETFHVPDRDLPSYESFDLSKSDILEEDLIGVEPGLIFFEDGSYSRGPLDIPVGEYDESKYFISPTFKFEQCLVKGCHKRLRIVHTIEFNEGGSSIQITRVAVYEEQWVSPANIDDGGDTQFDLKPISQRKRTQPSELTGSWKVFEVSATPVFSEETELEGELPFVYLCTETLKKRSLPESSVFFGEEEALDLQDVTVLWLPGGVTSYVDVNKDGVLTIGVGWYSDEGINLVMERDYGVDGKLKEVRWKSEVKRRWTDPFPV